jgi:hypothetical protein
MDGRAIPHTPKLNMDNLHDKLRKLLTLAQVGIGGEKVNAQSRLEALMEKHGISLSDLETENYTLEWFKADKSDYGKQLLYQTMRAVCGVRDYWTSKKRPGQHAMEMTKAEKIEIEIRYSAYLESLKKEMEICYSAFVQINKIFHKDSPPADPSETDEQEIKRLALAMMGMKPVPINKQLKQTAACAS